MKKHPKPFNIEEPVFNEWSTLLKENIQPHLALCGHEHEVYFELPDNDKGYPCPVIVGAKPIILNEDKKEYFTYVTAMTYFSIVSTA